MTGGWRRGLLGWWRALALALALCTGAGAGTLDRAALQAAFPSPWIVGERDPQLPVWPLYRQVATEHPLVAWAFESIDFAALPGFSGTPVNLLVLLDTEGRFAQVHVLSHHEPVFLDGLGEAPMHQFVEQYAGLSLQQTLRVGPPGTGAALAGQARVGPVVTLDGVAKATASVRVINESAVLAGLKVARAKLGFAEGRDPSQLARWRPDAEARPRDWDALRRDGLLLERRISAGEVRRAFAADGLGAAAAWGLASDGPPGTAPETSVGKREDDRPFVELGLAVLNLPAVAHSLLDARGRQRLADWLGPTDSALLVLARGAYSITGERFVRGSVPDRLVLRQGALPLELRDLDLDLRLNLPADWRGAEAMVFRVLGASGYDPSEPADLALRITRLKGQIFPERYTHEFSWRWQMPEDQVLRPDGAPQGWRAAWVARRGELALLGLALAALAAGLLAQHRLVRHARAFAVFRLLWLAGTAGFIGWWAQGQLSIVHLTSALRAWREARPLDFLLQDPASMLIWAAVAVSLVVWGRGFFCGWLCPYGALQEFAHHAGRLLRLPTWRPSLRWDRRLKRLKYVALALIVGAALSSAVWTDRLVEFEPFKTAITLGFQRSWPHVLWAAGLLALGMVVYKAWCRYLCPLGAALAVGGWLRRWDWIPRRAECGTPCQTCRHRCAYQAIEPQGRIDYAECFQCLDCVAIHDSDERCAPRIAARRGRTIPIRPLAPVAPAARSRVAASGRH